MKCTVHSDHGSMMIIPREKNLIRLYVQVGSSSDMNFDPHMKVSQDEVQTAARRILSPYQIVWECVDWFSIYPIRQGSIEKYSSANRIFLGGDSCHTHSVRYSKERIDAAIR